MELTKGSTGHAPAAAERLNGITITVSTGFGSGRTTLSAYDRALHEAGIGDYNLIYLSSVIPGGAQIVERSRPDRLDEWGHRLYVVVAEHRTSTVGEEAWAGVGWLQDDRSGRGLFVEHHGTSEARVIDDIETSLADMRSYRDDVFGDTKMVTTGGPCVDRPVCAVVAAVYVADGWTPPEIDLRDEPEAVSD